jgi:hypothetical protein
MLIISQFPPRFLGEDEEMITVTVSTQNPNMVFEVTCVINGHSTVVDEGDTFDFPLSLATPQSLLTIQLGFTPNNGTGVYRVTIKGNKDRFSFTDTYDSKFGVDPLEKPFSFSVRAA